jgi:hypothetical protein
MGGGGDSRNGPSSTIVELVSGNLEKIAERSRSFILLGSIVAIGVLGLVVVADDPVVQATVVAVFLALMLYLAFLLYRVARVVSGGDEDVDLAHVAEIYAEVNGEWWQLVINDREPGLSVISIDLSVLPNRHGLKGSKFVTSGKRRSTWHARAVAVMSISPLELFYYWVGSYAGSVDGVSGIGYYVFSTDEAGTMVGKGWYTTGNVESRDFSDSSAVHLRRLRESEKAALEAGGRTREETVSKLYATWLSEMESPGSSATAG